VTSPDTFRDRVDRVEAAQELSVIHWIARSP
jgi:hypothetical protein